MSTSRTSVFRRPDSKPSDQILEKFVLNASRHLDETAVAAQSEKVLHLDEVGHIEEVTAVLR